MTELLPCPFCGGGAIERQFSDVSYLCGCSNDECPVQPEAEGDSEKDARERWNTRAIEATRPTDEGLDERPRAWVDEKGVYRAPDGYHFTIIDAPGFDANGYPLKSAVLTPNVSATSHD